MKTKSPTLEAIAACEAALKEAKRQHEAARAAEAAAAGAVGEALKALNAAREAHDNTLPQCDLVTSGWRGDTKHRQRVAIVKRSDKRITIRRIGLDSEQCFRLDKRGNWQQFPKPGGYTNNTLTLENLPAPTTGEG